MPLTEFQARTSAIEGLTIMDLKQVSDGRGTVREFFRESVYRSLTPPAPSHFAQVNVTHSARGTIRGLHGEDVTKLVGVVAGSAFGAYVDARRSSPTFGKVETVPLELGVQVLVPSGVLNGFQSVSDGGCQYLYAFDAEWAPDMPGVSAHPLDPALAIPWPLPVDPTDPSQLSPKDAALPFFAAL